MPYWQEQQIVSWNAKISPEHCSSVSFRSSTLWPYVMH